MYNVSWSDCETFIKEQDEQDTGRRYHSDANSRWSCQGYKRAGNVLNHAWPINQIYDHALLPGSYFNTSLISTFAFKGLEDKVDGLNYIASHAPKLHTMPVFLCKVINNKIKLVVNLATDWVPLLEQCPGFLVKVVNKERLSYSATRTTICIEKYDNDKNSKFQAECLGDAGSPWQFYYKVEVDALSNIDDYHKMALKTKHEFDVLHINNWPDGEAIDQGVMLKIINHIGKVGPEPLWIHCEAGIGRTGTLMCALMASKDLKASQEACQKEDKEVIALEENGSKTDLELESFEIAKNMVIYLREHRPYMVQTASQFQSVVAFLHKLLQNVKA